MSIQEGGASRVEDRGPERLSGTRPSTLDARPSGPDPRPSSSRRSFANWFFYALIWILCWVFCQVWFRFLFTGRAHVPATGPVLLVANHQSHLDPVLVGVACQRQMRALARHSLFVWPLGWLIRSLGAVPIERERSALSGMKTTLKLLKDGAAVLVFPEGTRTPQGKLQPFQPGFCVLARRSGATIIPVAIDGAFTAMPRGSRFPRPRPIKLMFCPPIPPVEQRRRNDDELARLVTARIADAFRNS